MLKAVIFDMDGLLLDSEMISYKCYKKVLEDYGYNLTLDDYIKDYPGKPLAVSIHFINEKYHLNYDEEKITHYFHQLEEKYAKEDKVPLKKGALELLTYLKENQYKTIIATSSLGKRAHNYLGAHDLFKYFDDAVYGVEVKNGKPAPDIFLKAREKLQVLPQEALVLEDSEAGIQAAYDAHIPVICIPDLKQPKDEFVKKTEALLPSLNEVIIYIQEHK